MSDADSRSSRLQQPQAKRSAARPGWVHGVIAGIALYFFLAAINVMGDGLKVIGEAGDWLQRIFVHGENPFVALLGAVFVTAVVQSSSFTTALIITLVAAGDLPLGTAIFAIMGANIGTSVTGIIVSLGNIRIRRQFRRAFTSALFHDVFNLLSVAVLFPLEWITGTMHPEGRGWIARLATWMTQKIGAPEIENPDSPVKVLTRPVVATFDALAGLIPVSPVVQGILIAVFGLILLFCALVAMVKNLKGALVHRLEGLFRSYFFRNDLTSYIVGVISTVLVQASTITTSLIVPLAGAGIIKIKRVYAFMLGANLGTTFTGVLAATANPVAAAVTVALFHVTFNLIGTAIWYPLRFIPIGLSRWYGRLAAESKRYAFIFLLVVFVVIPVTGLVITEIFFR